ncbi:MAG: hypothetical protein LKM45_05850 [Wolbachia endosymbiont of Alcedoecus sp.]|nr:hypothetical protein [Wolbachia endosymbiont of Alcedoecus sp.]
MLEFTSFRTTSNKREDGSKNYLWVLFNSINRLVLEKAHNQWWNIPPRCAKTTLGFIFHIAFALGNNPRAKFMYITHQRDLMREKINELHMVLESPFYRQVFPSVKVVGRRSTRVIRTKEGGFVNGFSISGHVTGTGAGDSSFDVMKFVNMVVVLSLMIYMMLAVLIVEYLLSMPVKNLNNV